MERNRAKQKIAAGEIVCALAGLDNSDKIDFMGQFGFDAAWIECEHGGVGWHQIADMTRACDLWGMSPILRVNGNQPWLITRYLDQGATGIVVPHVNTREDAEQAVKSAKFAPLGYRGIYGGRPSYGVENFFSKANDQTMVIVLIEEMRAVENLDELLGVDGIDVYHVAPGDLAQTMGYLGQPGHPEVQAVVEKSIKKIAKAGKCPGATMLSNDPAHYIDIGARFLYISAMSWMAQGAKRFMERLKA